MSALQDDVEMLESAMRLLFQSIKRPQSWTQITDEAGLVIDRPAAIILHTLAMSKTQSRVHDLATQLGIEAPSVTRKTQELERAGYLKRVADPVDRRAICLQITPKGKDVSTRIWKVQRDRISRVLKDWDPEQRRLFVELFQRYSTGVATVSHEAKHN